MLVTRGILQRRQADKALGGGGGKASGVGHEKHEKFQSDFLFGNCSKSYLIMLEPYKLFNGRII
jgi:hypothetical protein